MKILGIETSCDETAAAVVIDGRDVRSSVINSQVDLHSPYGGVVPEIASRCHSEALPGVIEAALAEAGCGWGDLDALAVTYGPGLSSSLIVGLAAAKGLALRLNLPLIGVNHLQAHIHSVFLAPDAPDFDAVCPFMSLVVSGGHTCLVRVEGMGQYTLVGETIDDAAGEAFDKGANLMSLGYPGGPVIDRIAKAGARDAVAFPRVKLKQRTLPDAAADADLYFSYSGLKTALLYYLKGNPEALEGDPGVASVAASYQEAIIDTLVLRCERALRGGLGTLAVGGGVSLNSRLRARLQELADRKGIQLLLAPARFCADNAAMIAGLAGAGGGRQDGMALDVYPSLPICD